ncbi:hypothetical protein BHM03_00043239 [Ensete ventricosum]|nr:hypothetical protein BHM03_00043239 [Ensete ventricosum]
MRARWSNLSYTTKGWDDSQAASEFEWGVLLPTLAKDLYTLPSEILMAQAAKQITLMSNWAPKDLNAMMQAQWSNLSYTTKVWNNSQEALEFGRRVLHPTLAKDLYTLPSKILMAQAVKTNRGHHYQVALFDRVHDVGRLVTLMGNRASHLEAEVAKLKSEGDPKQLAIARQ